MPIFLFVSRLVASQPPCVFSASMHTGTTLSLTLARYVPPILISSFFMVNLLVRGRWIGCHHQAAGTTRRDATDLARGVSAQPVGVVAIVVSPFGTMASDCG